MRTTLHRHYHYTKDNDGVTMTLLVELILDLLKWRDEEYRGVTKLNFDNLFNSSTKLL